MWFSCCTRDETGWPKLLQLLSKWMNACCILTAGEISNQAHNMNHVALHGNVGWTNFRAGRVFREVSLTAVAQHSWSWPRSKLEAPTTKPCSQRNGLDTAGGRNNLARHLLTGQAMSRHSHEHKHKHTPLRLTLSVNRVWQNFKVLDPAKAYEKVFSFGKSSTTCTCT